MELEDYKDGLILEVKGKTYDGPDDDVDIGKKCCSKVSVIAGQK